MIAAFWLIVGALVGGAMFRLRGWDGFERLTGRGATTARLVWAAAMGLLAWAAWGEWPLALAAGAGLFVGSLPGWYRSISLGRNPHDQPALGAYARHAARGLFWTLPAAAAVLAVGWWLDLSAMDKAARLTVAGLSCVPAYEIGWRLRPPHDTRWPGATEIGEVLFGAAIGAAIVGGETW